MTNLTGTKILVTGAGGFIGSHLTERLVELGAKVRALVHYRADGSWGWIDQSPCRDDVEVVAGDVRDRDSILRAARDAEKIFHLAALIGIPYSYQSPTSYIQTNIEGTLNILQAARQCNVERVIHTSTSEVYGTARYVPMDENHPLQAQSPYAASKIGADKLAESFFLSFGLPVVVVRPFNTFGPRQSARAIVPTIISQCLNGRTVRLGNLQPVRDMNYVRDTVDGFIRASVCPEAVGSTINIGSSREISVENIARLIASLIGSDIIIESQAERVRPDKSEVERLLADNTAARRLLGWQPSTTFEKGLQITIEWMREHLRGYRSGLYAL